MGLFLENPGERLLAMEKKLSSLVGSVLFWCILGGCTFFFGKSRKDLTAEEVLEAYLNKVFTLERIDQKSELLTYTTGSLREAIAQTDDQTFQEAYLEKNRYELTRYSLIQRRDQTPMETHLTYQIVYREKTSQSETSTENTVMLIRQDSQWFIQEVLGHKTSVDFPIDEVISGKGP